MAPTATPPRINRIESIRPETRPAIAKVRQAAASPKTDARSQPGTTASAGTVSPRTMPSAAPWLIPRIAGEASGLRVTACNRRPATPRLIPRPAAASVRGRRMSRIVCSAGLAASPAKSPASCASPTSSRPPVNSEASAPAARTQVRTAPRIPPRERRIRDGRPVRLNVRSVTSAWRQCRGCQPRSLRRSACHGHATTGQTTH